jgi:hypothetical protein
MSSQSVNSTAYSGYSTASTGGNAAANNTKLGQIPMRDGADYTRQIREQIVYRENVANSPVQPGDSEHKWLMYGNRFRLTYLFGKLKCPTACSGSGEVGGAFNGNGAYATIPVGATYGGS